MNYLPVGELEIDEPVESIIIVNGPEKFGDSAEPNWACETTFNKERNFTVVKYFSFENVD